MTKETMICFICKKPVEVEQAEMIIGPERKRVFCHTYHAGVLKEANKEDDE